MNAEPIVEITARFDRDARRAEYEIDDLVMATGYDAVSGPYLRMGIVWRKGLRLVKEEWREGAQTYLGLAMAGFPNLFTITGPLSATPLTNVIRAIEHHVDWISDCLDYVLANNVLSIGATREAQEDWDRQVAKVGALTFYPSVASWYTGGNIEESPAN